jgi:hypothetical protein
MSKHCTIGSPAPIIVANCRVKREMSIFRIRLEVGSRISDAFLVTEVTKIRLERKILSNSARFLAFSSPATAAPPIDFPLYSNTGIASPLF